MMKKTAMRKRFIGIALLFLLMTILSLVPLAVSAEGEADTRDIIQYDGIAARLAGDDAGIRSLYTVDMNKVEALKSQGYRVAFGAVMGIGEHEGTSFVPRDATALTVTKGAEGFTTVNNAAFVLVYDSSVAANNGVVGKVLSNADGICEYAYTCVYGEEHTPMFSVAGIIFRGFVYIEKDGNGEFIYANATGDTFGGLIDGAPALYGTSTSVNEVYTYFANTYEEENEKPYFFNQKCISILHKCLPAGEHISRNIVEAPPTLSASGISYSGCEWQGCPEHKTITLKPLTALSSGTLTASDITTSGNDATILVTASQNGFYRLLVTDTAEADTVAIYNTSVAENGDAYSMNTSGNALYVYCKEGENTLVYRRKTTAPSVTGASLTMVSAGTPDITLYRQTDDVTEGLGTGASYIGGVNVGANEDGWVIDGCGIRSYTAVSAPMTYHYQITVKQAGYYLVTSTLMAASDKDSITVTIQKSDGTPILLTKNIQMAMNAVGVSGETDAMGAESAKLAELGYVYLKADTYVVSVGGVAEDKVYVGQTYFTLNTEKKTTQEIIYVTDLHFNVKNQGNANCLNMNGLTGEMRAQYMVDCIKAKYDEMLAEDPDAELFAFITGDLCSSEYNYRLFDPRHASYAGKTYNSTYDTDEDGDIDLDDFFFTEWDPIWTLKTKYLDQLKEYGNIYYYCIPGNHDAYQNEKWNELFGYGDKNPDGSFKDPHILAYDESSTGCTVRVNEDTAVVLLNTFDENRGAMETDRNPNDGVEKYYLLGNEQTLGYTSFDTDVGRRLVNAACDRNVKNVYLASHQVLTDAPYTALVSEFKCIKGLVMGDAHQDYIIGDYLKGVPRFIVGHFSGSGMSRPGNPKFDIDIKTLPHSYVTQKDGLFTYYKVENAYFGVDNKTFIEKYFNLAKIEGATKSIDVMGENIIGLTDYTTELNASGVEKDVSPLYFYRYTLRTDLTPEEQAVGERIKYFLDEYNIGVHLISGSATGSTGLHYDYTSLSYQRYYLDESFYQPLTAYKTHKISE